MTDPGAFLPDSSTASSPAPTTSPRSRGVALVIGLVLGLFGGHRFYAGKIASGVLQLCTLGGLGLWWLYDMILVSAGEFTDIDGRRISRWSTAGTMPLSGGGEHQLEHVVRELDSLQGQVSELAERVDFAERLLTRGRDGSP